MVAGELQFCCATMGGYKSLMGLPSAPLLGVHTCQSFHPTAQSLMPSCWGCSPLKTIHRRPLTARLSPSKYELRDRRSEVRRFGSIRPIPKVERYRTGVIYGVCNPSAKYDKITPNLVPLLDLRGIIQASVSLNFSDWLTPSTPAGPNCCCPNSSAPHCSKPLFLIFVIRAFWLSVLSARAPECQKNSNGELDQYMAECKALTGSAVKGLNCLSC